MGEDQRPIWEVVREVEQEQAWEAQEAAVRGGWFKRYEGFVFMGDDELVDVLRHPGPLTKAGMDAVVDNLCDRLTMLNCEEWSLEIGLALLARLRRDVEP